MSARKKTAQAELPKFQGGGGGAGGSRNAAVAMIELSHGTGKPRSKQHTVRVESIAGWYRWERQAPNGVVVARSARDWNWWEKRHAIRAARAEARLTGARLVIDGQEVDV